MAATTQVFRLCSNATLAVFDCWPNPDHLHWQKLANRQEVMLDGVHQKVTQEWCISHHLVEHLTVQAYFITCIYIRSIPSGFILNLFVCTAVRCADAAVGDAVSSNN